MAALTLKALGMDKEQARAVVELFREHDERLLRDQHLVYDDDVALRQTTREAYEELQGLFEADTAPQRREAIPDASSPVSPPVH
jgi:glutathione-regulated potassium-efflux system protein KefB